MEIFQILTIFYTIYKKIRFILLERDEKLQYGFIVYTVIEFVNKVRTFLSSQIYKPS